MFGAGFPVELHWRVTSDPFLALTFPFDVILMILGGTIRKYDIIIYDRQRALNKIDYG